MPIRLSPIDATCRRAEAPTAFAISSDHFCSERGHLGARPSFWPRFPGDHHAVKRERGFRFCLARVFPSCRLVDGPQVPLPVIGIADESVPAITVDKLDGLRQKERTSVCGHTGSYYEARKRQNALPVIASPSCPCGLRGRYPPCDTHQFVKHDIVKAVRISPGVRSTFGIVVLLDEVLSVSKRAVPHPIIRLPQVERRGRDRTASCPLVGSHYQCAIAANQHDNRIGMVLVTVEPSVGWFRARRARVLRHIRGR